jgi:hypothetical protein
LKENLQQITADIDDLEFLRRFQARLKNSKTFRELQIAPDITVSGAMKKMFINSICVDIEVDLIVRR